MLLQDEKNIVEWLGEYGPLLEEQVILLLHDKSGSVAEKIIRSLIRRNHIVKLEGGYLALTSVCVPDRRLITAIWVLTRFIHRIDPLAHYQAKYPSQILFLSKDILYEIIVLETNEDKNLLRLLRPEENTKYIIAIHDEALINNRFAPNAPCLYAFFHASDGNIPAIEFFQGGKHCD